jgi:quercetin dioxygenase-like cupin family protein
LEGEAEIIIENDKFILKQGQMIIMPKNIPHAINAIKRFKMILILIGN